MFVPPRWGDRRNVRIGLLGGSFNPAHDGHVHISEEARRRFALDEVWWLVSPQNPLKPKSGMASMPERIAQARIAARFGWIKVTSIEAELGTTRTWMTLARLRVLFPKAGFIWLMGADNLEQIPKWARWSKIFQAAHVAVFDRSPYSYNALFGKAARRFGRFRLRATHGSAVWSKPGTRWVYEATRRHPASSTEIRRLSGQTD